MSSCVDFRFVSLNYAFETNVNITGTSENPSFPASNVGREHRSKVWRSNGFYVIDSTNNKINFREVNAGPELTATLTSGEYDRDELRAEIKAGLEAVGSNTYTVTFGTGTGKFTIASSGAFFELLFSSGSDAGTSSRSVIGFGNNDFVGSTSYTGAFVSIHTVERLVLDLQTSEMIDTISLLFDPVLGIRFSEQAVVKLKASASDSWSAPLFEQTLTIDNEYSAINVFLTTAIEHRFWCIEIVDPKNPDLYVELGTIVVGLSDNLLRIPDNGFNYRIEDQSKIDETEFGHVYADLYPKRRSIDFTFNLIDYDQVETMHQIFQRVGGSRPVFVALDTAEEIFDKDDIVLLGRMKLGLDFSHIVRGYFSKKLSIVESM